MRRKPTFNFNWARARRAAAPVTLPPLAVLGTLILVTACALLKADPVRLASMARPGRLWTLGPWRIPIGLGLLATVGSGMLPPIATLVWRAGRVGGVAARGATARVVAP